MTDAPEVGWGPLCLAWTGTAAAYVVKAQLGAATTPLLLDADDAMRLTEVRDLLHGQGWFDLVQHRLDTPYGGLMHWSRLIDLPEAVLLGLLRLPFGLAADTVLAVLWPLLLLLPLIWLSARLAMRLGGREALLPGLLLPAFSLVTLAEFGPGRLDHHSSQILLGLAMLDCAIGALRRPGLAVCAGIAAAAALAIGIEALPMVAATVLVFGLAWAADERFKVALRDFGLSFALGTAVALALGVAPDRWFVPMFDAVSIVYAAAAVLCGAAFLVLSLLPLRSQPGRLLAGICAGLAAAGAVVIVWPAILHGPYGMLDPWLIANWIDRISEAQPWFASLAADPVYPLAVGIPPLLALGFSLWIFRRGPVAGAWLIYAGVLVVAIAVALLQIRAVRLAAPIAVPGCAAMIASAWRWQSRTRGLLPPLAVVGGWLGSAGIAVGVVATLGVLAVPGYAAATDDSFRADRQACLMPSAFTDLGGLPPERIMAPIDLGSHLLAFTGHSVVAAPYHRSQDGVLDAFRFFNEPISEARRILERRGIGLVVICPAMKEIRGLVDHAPDSFVSLYAKGALPSWLVDRSLPGSPLRIYAVTRGPRARAPVRPLPCVSACWRSARAMRRYRL